MATDEPVRQYVVFDADRLFGRKVDFRITASSLDDALWPLLQKTNQPIPHEDYSVESVPIVEFVTGDAQSVVPRPPMAQEVFSVISPSEAAARRFRDAAFTAIERNGADGPLSQLGVNPMIEAAEFSFPVAPDAALFGTLADARRLIRSDQMPAALDGGNVNVVVIDAGIDRSMIPPGQFGGGWRPMPGGPSPPAPSAGMATGLAARHGMMVVNNILAMAPKATIFDVPLIRPPKIGDIPGFLALAEATYRTMLSNILGFRTTGQFTGPWVFMNAWTIYDRRSEAPFLGEYTENLGANGITPHPFIKLIEEVASKNFDIVFCAGNCGRICPDGRCGPNDYGPGRSIWGANAHKNVLSVGAVRVDGTWLGYSSEGRGPLKLDEYKPDLCAPSQFEGTQGEYPSSTGTSAAAAISAGIIAALRSRPSWNQTAVSPTALKQILNATATKTQGAGWNQTIGNGILNANAAWQALPPPRP